MRIKHDINGNRCLSLDSHDLGGARGFSIQTQGNLPQTHRNGIGEHTLPEVREYIRDYGSKRQKELFAKGGEA